MTESPRDLRIDDSEPVIAYSQPEKGHHWTQHLYETAYNKTLHLTRTRGASARFKFEGGGYSLAQSVPRLTPIWYIGVAIAVYGHLNDESFEDPVSRYSVDDGPTSIYAPSLRTERSQVLFFHSGALDPGNHTLFIVNEREGAFLWIDSFVITHNPPSATSSMLSASPLVKNIVGGLLGSLAFCALLAVVCYYVRRRKRQKHDPEIPTFRSGSVTPLDRPSSRPFLLQPTRIPHPRSITGTQDLTCVSDKI
ncbi:hypothetical protein FA15DRAFT_733747 [Coprinopsis marcescibilis]|uniref:Transmembrane protein n=1 Tax=Coprinopsis marcescibilis TaxID=230819 RepID=A0A5C3KZM0_COPMA|nr:hypothetical protein FA15DRAFT_733747 [Coprinopsis marcescibilis]